MASPGKLIVKPLAGLANRLRVIDSAVHLAAHLGQPLVIVWNKERALNCRYEDLFLPVPEFTVKHDAYDHLRTAIRPWESISFMLRERLGLFINLPQHLFICDKHPSRLPAIDSGLYRHKRRIFISTAHRFGNSGIIARMKPVPEIAERIDDICRDFGTITYGMHIRRGDSLLSVVHSPEELFSRKIDELIRTEPGSRVFLATDDSGLKEKFMKQFQGHLITNDHDIRRDSREGIRNALIDLYCLGKTGKIFGSYYSSFSATAADISGVPIEILETETRHGMPPARPLLPSR